MRLFVTLTYLHLFFFAVVLLTLLHVCVCLFVRSDEFGHALGIGTGWSCPSTSFSNSPRANQEYQDISGCSTLVKTEGNAFGGSDNNCIQYVR